METNKKFLNYLSTHPGFKQAKPNKEKIEWIKFNLLSHYKSVNKKGRFLDIGPGLGETLIVWKKMGVKDINSIDISQEVVKHIKKLGFNCNLVENSTQYLKTKKKQFDFINLNDVLEHIPHDELFNFVEAVYQALKHQGQLLIKSPNAQSPFFGVVRYADITHTIAFTENSLSQLLSQARFKKFEFLAEKQLIRRGDFKGIIANRLFAPLFFWYVRKIRSATFHLSPKILTQAIIAVATKN